MYIVELAALDARLAGAVAQSPLVDGLATAIMARPARASTTCCASRSNSSANTQRPRRREYADADRASVRLPEPPRPEGRRADIGETWEDRARLRPARTPASSCPGPRAATCGPIASRPLSQRLPLSQSRPRPQDTSGEPIGKPGCRLGISQTRTRISQAEGAGMGSPPAPRPREPPARRGAGMPLVNVKLAAGAFTEKQKHDMAARLTDVMVALS